MAANGVPHVNGLATQSRPVIPISSRLKEGRALAEDVWSIYKCVVVLTRITIVSFLFSATNLPSDCINLGQGYMNFAPPQWVRSAADEALSTVVANHYSHPRGRIRLRQAIKKHFDPLFGRELDVESEIIVTSGANEGK